MKKKNTGPRPIRGHSFTIAQGTARFQFAQGRPDGVHLRRSSGGHPWRDLAPIAFASFGGRDEREDFRPRA